MPRKLRRIDFNFHAAEYTQISESHCGPAVIQMLLAHCGVVVSQVGIAEAAGVTDLIEMHGTRIDQLAAAVRKIAPQMQFWYKDHSRMKDLIALVKTYRYPVGVEWQGLFDDEEAETDSDASPEGNLNQDDSETGDDDYGHYSVVIHVDLKNRMLIIADPYKDYISQDRIFSFKDFRERWYDHNEIEDPRTGRPRLIEDTRMMFIITPLSETFPIELGMKRGEGYQPVS